MNWRSGVRDLLVLYMGLPKATADGMADEGLWAELSYRSGLLMGCLAREGTDPQRFLKTFEHRDDEKPPPNPDLPVLLPKVADLLDHAIEVGVTRGWSLAHKHTDTPSEDDLKAAMADAVFDSISDWFVFPDQYK